MARRKLTSAEDQPSVEPDVLELLIRWDRAAGKLTVTGPIGQGVFCYGMLERAREIGRAHV